MFVLRHRGLWLVCMSRTVSSLEELKKVVVGDKMHENLSSWSWTTRDWARHAARYPGDDGVYYSVEEWLTYAYTVPARTQCRSGRVGTSASRSSEPSLTEVRIIILLGLPGSAPSVTDGRRKTVAVCQKKGDVNDARRREPSRGYLRHYHHYHHHLYLLQLYSGGISLQKHNYLG